MPLDSIPVLSITDRVLDDNGDPVSGAVLTFFEAGTSTPFTVYSDSGLSTSLGTSVTCDSGGYPTSDGSTRVQIYTGTSSYKVVVKDSGGTTLWTLDNVKGAPVIPTSSSTGLPETPVISKTSSYSVVVADQGKLINANCTGGSFAITLPSAVTAGDAFRIGVRHNGTANVVTIRTTGGDVIRSSGQNSLTAFALSGLGQTVWLVSDGAGWSVDTEVPALINGGVAFISVADRVTAPPSSPVGGTRYLINGTPTGTWLTLSFAEHDIAESDGNGSWFKYTPSAGWLAYIVDEDLYTSFDGTTWNDQGGMATPSSSTLAYAIYDHQATSGTGGGTNTSGSWTTRPLTTEVVDTIGASLSSNEITLPVGKYLVFAGQQLHQSFGTLGSTGIAQQRLTAVTATMDATYLGMPSRDGGVASGAGVTFTDTSTHNLRDTWLINVTVAGSIKLEYHTSWSTTTNGLGYPASNGVEVYARVTILDLASLQGPAGPQGSQGPDGLDAAHPYTWSTATTGDPGSGAIRGNNATIASITEIGISETDSAGANKAAVIATWDDATSSVRGRIMISKEGAVQNYHYFSVTGAGTDQGSYWEFPVTYVGTGGTISNGNDVAVNFIYHGDQGDPGTTVPDISGLTIQTDNDGATDILAVYDADAASTKGVYPHTFGMTQSGTGAVRRDLIDEIRDVVKAAQFGFSSSASGADNKTALDNALTRAAAIGRCAVELPDGQFSITGTVSSSADNIAIVGNGKSQTVLVQQTASAPTLSFSGNYVGLHGIGISYASTPTSGADAITLAGDYADVSDVWVITADRGIVISGDGSWISRSKVTTVNVNGILATSSVGGRWSDIQIEAGGTSKATLGCIRLTDGTEAIEATNIECLTGTYSITTDATTPGFGTEPAYNQFTNCIFDGAGQGSTLTDLSTTQFVNCWWSGGRTGGGYYGVVLDNCTDVSFVNNTVVNCGSGGMYIAATSSNIRVIGGIVGSNSVTSGSGTNHGIEIAANTNDVTILYPTGGNAQVPGGQQGYDVSVAAGTSGRVVVRLSSAGGVTGVATHGGTGSGNIMELNGTVYQGGSWIPFVNDGGAIGASGQAVSDVFVASGGVINFNAGNVALTHSAGQLVATAGALGYGTGNGGTITQITSRTTGVTLNKLTGQITLVSAAGSATPASFTVTNSTVAATDEINVWQVSGTDKYVIHVTAVGSGSFEITSYTTGGTTTETPVFAFAVRKGATS